MFKTKPIYFCFILFISALKLSAQSEIAVHKKFTYPDGTVSAEGYMLDGKPEGYWKNYYPNGILKSEGNRKNFELDSIWKFYDEKGFLQKTISYLYGMKNGYYETYQMVEKADTSYPALVSKELYLNDQKEGITYLYEIDGSLKQSIPYKSGQKEGRGFRYGSDGKPNRIDTYRNNILFSSESINRFDKNGAKSGTWKEFFDDGSIKIEQNYVEGKLNGYQRVYANSGQIEKVSVFQNDSVIETDSTELAFAEPVETVLFYADSSLKFRGLFRDSVPVGIHRFYNRQGEIDSACIYSDFGDLLEIGIVDENGRRQGNFKEFFPSGTVKAEGSYTNNLRNGKWIFYTQDQKISQAGIFKDGKFHGPWKWFYADGSTRRYEEYASGTEHGKVKEYDSTGTLILNGVYNSGLREGKWLIIEGDSRQVGEYRYGLKIGEWKHFYFPSGQLQFKGEFRSGKPYGKHTYYYEKGKPEHFEFYKNGKAHKAWTYFNKDSSVKFIIYYKRGREVRIETPK